MATSPKPIVLCYISGLDVRRIDAETTEFLSRHLLNSASQKFTNLPSNELFPTLVTGVDPTHHGVWGVKLSTRVNDLLSNRLIDYVPDIITTTLQCAMHFATSNFDLAAIPPRRRRRFELTRTKYKRRGGRNDAIYQIGRYPTILSIVGADSAKYFFSSSANPASTVLHSLCLEGNFLEVLELYSLDRYQQWNLHREDRVLKAYSELDQFLSQLLEKCEQTGRTLAIVSDHGHEKISKSISLIDRIGRLDLTDADYSVFVEVSSARFWFHNDRARNMIESELRKIAGAELVSFDNMWRHGVPLDDDAYGELFCFLDPGHIFFPHDFYQPVANILFGLTDSRQRARLSDPRHRGNHGHLPYHDVENSFMLIADTEVRRIDNMPASILDIAPSLLQLLGKSIPKHMTGRALFERD